MKQKIVLLLTTVILCCAGIRVLANETEPNNTKATANTLTLNGNNTGAINVSGDEDWWSVTTNGDGKLSVTITISNALNLSCYVYDNNGTTLLGSMLSSSTNTLNLDGLATGTYYIKLNSYYAGQLPAYTISNTLTKPTEANDAEPNNIKSQAKVLPLNGSKTGHINYYYNNIRDSQDWYKVTTNADGRLRLRLSSGNGYNVRAYLYDNNGTTLLASGYTSTTTDINADGLAAGTYYIRINSFYNYLNNNYSNDNFEPYTIADSLFTPAMANDIEPNDTKATALTLPLNGSKTGHVNYYYNNIRDSQDWYKVTTNADGRLRLRLSSGNGYNVWAYLYDNNGTTLLASGYTSTTTDINADGLAAGTYYIRINSYYHYLDNNYSNDHFEPYTIADSLFTPGQANDAEPNNTSNQAIVMVPNSTMTGHVNYYYNNVKDTFDWYEITIPDDGNINIAITSHNGQNIYAYFYDHDGSTQLNSKTTTGTDNFNIDGLQKGTYYLKLKTYYSSEFIPYTVTNTFTTYTNATDTVPNDAPYQALTMKANQATTGHVNFYYNGNRDVADWLKINYTGSGSLTLNLTQEAHITGGNNNLSVYVYKDTLQSYIASQTSTSSSWQMNLNSLTQGYYYIKVKTYYNSEFVSYTIEDVFTQVNVAKISVTSYDTASSCSSTNKIAFKPRKSQAPYTVQLYRFGVAYGAPLTITNNHNFFFNNLPTGSYYATVYGDGASGTAFGKSTTINLEPIPQNLTTTNITNTQAKLNWNGVACAGYYTIQYRVQGDPNWLKKKTKNTTPSFILKGLTANTTYEWQVATSDSANGIIATGVYSSIATFTTNAVFSGANNGNEEGLQMKAIMNDDINGISVFPNPASTQVKIQMSAKITGTVDLLMKAMNGKVVWTAIHKDAASINGSTINVGNLPSGIYMLQIILQDGKVYTTKVVVTR